MIPENPYIKTKYLYAPIEQFPVIQDVWNTTYNLKKMNIVHAAGFQYWIAGGSLVRALEGSDPYASDVDIYRKLGSNKDTMSRNTLKANGWKFGKTAWSTTEWVEPCLVKPSVMDFYTPYIELALESFDLEICRVATDGVQLIYSPGVLPCINNKELRLTHTIDVSLDRLNKYTSRGYVLPDTEIAYIYKLLQKNDVDTKYANIETNIRSLLELISNYLWWHSDQEYAKREAQRRADRAAVRTYGREMNYVLSTERLDQTVLNNAANYAAQVNNNNLQRPGFDDLFR